LGARRGASPYHTLSRCKQKDDDEDDEDEKGMKRRAEQKCGKRGCPDRKVQFEAEPRRGVG